jgi:glycosyltransferase involved in cell wall biosynthesis
MITGEYPPMSGGVGAYTAELAAALTAQGLPVSVLTSVNADAPGNDTRGVDVYPVMRGWGWGLWRTGLAWARRLEADWLHVQYQTAAFAMHPAVNFAPAWWRDQGRQVAWTYHDLLPPYLFPKAGGPLRRWVTTRPAATAHLTLVTNGDDQQALMGVARRLAVVPIGSNIAVHSLDAAARRAQRIRRGLGDDDLVIGYFGFLNRSKGGLTLMRVLAHVADQVPTAKLLMIGEQVGASDASNRQYLLEVEQLMAELGLTDRVIWTGHQPAATVSADLHACDLLLMPYVDGASLRRGTLMAGLAHGCAIVTTTPQTPIAELTDGRELLYVPPEDVEAATAAVMRLVHTPALVTQLRGQARAAGATFSWEGIADAHLRLYATDTTDTDITATTRTP